MDDNNMPMDEFAWEEFMKKSDAMADKFAALMEKYMDHPERDDIIAREMGWSRGNTETEEQSPIDAWNDLSATADEPEEGEEWKRAAGIDDPAASARETLWNDPIHRKAHALAVTILRWSQTLPETIRESPLVAEVVTNVTYAAAKTAGGTAFTNDRPDNLGAVIAIQKRALTAVNVVLESLGELKTLLQEDAEIVQTLIAETTEFRETIAVHIVEMREKFNGQK